MRAGTVARRLARAASAPLRRTLDRRVEWGISLLDDRLGLHDGPRPTLHDRIDDLQRLARLSLLAHGLPDARADEGPLALEALDERTATFLDWANGPDGYAAQAGLFLNPPVPVQHRPGGAHVLHVTERIVEQPYVFGVLHAHGARRILDLGGGESTVALSLAALGAEVHVVDPRGVPVAHPRLTVHPCRADELAPDIGDFDAVVALSAVEHFGLGHYAGDATGGERADLAALRTARDLLRPDGILVLTVPFGTAREDDLERTYDDAGLDALLRGYEAVERRVLTRTGTTRWDEGRAGDGPGVALVTARPQRPDPDYSSPDW